LDDGQGAGETFHGLIKGRVERVAGAARDHDIDRLGYAIANDAADEVDAFFECSDHVAGDEFERPPIGVNHYIDNKIAADLAADPRVLFMNGIAVENAAIGFRVLQK